MASKLKELLAQRAVLDQQIAEAQRHEKAEAVAQVRALMSEYGLTAADLHATPRAARPAVKSGGKVAPKYRDRETGNTWSGRGLQPRWLREALAAGRRLEDFAI